MAYGSLTDYFRQQSFARRGFYSPRFRGPVQWPTTIAGRMNVRHRSLQEQQSKGVLRKHALKMGQTRIRRKRRRVR